MTTCANMGASCGGKFDKTGKPRFANFFITIHPQLSFNFLRVNLPYMPAKH